MSRLSPILSASLGGVLGLSVALFLASDRSYTASVILPVQDGFLVEKVSRELDGLAQNSGAGISVSADGARLIFQTKGPLAAAEKTISKLWLGSRQTLLENLEERQKLFDSLKEECLASESCLLSRDYESIYREAELRLNERLVPVDLAPYLEWTAVGNAPNDVFVLAIGTGAGVAGGLAIWWGAIGRRASRTSTDVQD